MPPGRSYHEGERHRGEEGGRRDSTLADPILLPRVRIPEGSTLPLPFLLAGEEAEDTVDK